MRIVSGKLKGRRFSPPASFHARPTTDQARENLFNILNNLIDFEGQQVLDLFGGTGAISYEFASRGVGNITCVEKNYAHYRFIRQTIESFGIGSQVKVVKADVLKFLKKIPQQYTLIFADPPFDLPQLSQIPGIIMNSGILNNEGFFILEHGPDYNFEDFPFHYQTRHYGKVNFSIFSACL